MSNKSKVLSMKLTYTYDINNWFWKEKYITNK